jgi:hypothetical protein
VTVAPGHVIVHGRDGVPGRGSGSVALGIDDAPGDQCDAEDGDQQRGEGGDARRGGHHDTTR